MACTCCGLDLPTTAYRDAIEAWKEAVCTGATDGRPGGGAAPQAAASDASDTTHDARDDA